MKEYLDGYIFNNSELRYQNACHFDNLFRGVIFFSLEY